MYITIMVKIHENVDVYGSAILNNFWLLLRAERGFKNEFMSLANWRGIEWDRFHLEDGCLSR
jgi:hypothetical protein